MANTIRIKRGIGEPLAGSLVTGELAIDTSSGDLYSKLDDGSVTKVVSKASNISIIARNETGSPIPAGKVVYINGASGNKATITLAQANSEPSSTKTVGLTAATINHQNNGEVVIFGTLSKIDTLAYSAGTKLWLSPTTAGELTSTIPTAPNHAVFIGDVVRSHQNQGQIEVRVQNGFELQELHNVSINGIAGNNILAYESSTQLWKNKTAAQLGLATLESPALTGTPTAPTATTATSGTQIANQSYVYNAISAYGSGGGGGGLTNQINITTETSLILAGGTIYKLYWSGTNINLTIDPNALTIGQEVLFFQFGDAKYNFLIPAQNFAARWDNKYKTAGQGAIVRGIMTNNGFYLYGDLDYLDAGIVISEGCGEFTTLDFMGDSWTGYFNHLQEVTNGTGGTTVSSQLNSGGCWYPYGFVLNWQELNTLVLNWYAYDLNSNIINSGQFNYDFDTETTIADGSGGQTVLNDHYTAPTGTVIASGTFYYDAGGFGWNYYYEIIYDGSGGYFQTNTQI